MLHALMVTEAPSGGTGRHLIDLTNGLRERGCTVSIAYSPWRTDAVFRDFVARFDGVSTHVIPMRRGPHWTDGRALFALRRLAERAGPFDVVHGHSSKAGLVVRVAGLRGRSAVLYTPHGIYTNNPTNGRASRMVARVIERGLGARCDAVIAVSPEERDHLHTLGIPAPKIHYVPNGVRPCAWRGGAEVRADLGLGEGVVVGFIGRLAKEKDPLLLIEAFGRLAPRFRDATLAIVGEGPLEESCRARAAEVGVEDRVRWLGYRRAEEALPAFDILAIPSRSESLPYVLLEAFSAGVPVVACAVGGMREAVRDDHNGVLVRAHSPALFAAGLERVLADRALRRRVAAGAAGSAREFAVDVMVERTLALYRGLLAARRNGRVRAPASRRELASGWGKR